MEFWYFFSPFFTFLLFTFNICIRDEEMTKDQVFKVADDRVVDLPITLVVYAYQILIIFVIVVAIDHCVANRFKKADTHKDGEMPPHL